VSTVAQQEVSGAPALPPATALDDVLRHASPAEVIAAALKIVGREHLALVSSFGTESAALLKVMADVDPAIPVDAAAWAIRRTFDQAAGRDAVARGSRQGIVV
jgi:phosphoadenosine phosphosulfate reductase